ncbi:hypothetical protein [Haloarchaeobius baliensis]|uniref:hypothetical protein n=1 Tax=Haloarchaeobius baliensis TaxID=1670458 RepID=UPI003F88205F
MGPNRITTLVDAFRAAIFDAQRAALLLLVLFVLFTLVASTFLPRRVSETEVSEARVQTQETQPTEVTD